MVVLAGSGEAAAHGKTQGTALVSCCTRVSVETQDLSVMPHSRSPCRGPDRAAWQLWFHQEFLLKLEVWDNTSAGVEQVLGRTLLPTASFEKPGGSLRH